MTIYKTVQKVISQDSQQNMQFLEYKTTLSSIIGSFSDGDGDGDGSDTKQKV